MLSIPVELLTHIFEACDDFSQAVALASTCKRTYLAWETSSGTIIRSVGEAEIRLFEDALMAVNAQSI